MRNSQEAEDGQESNLLDRAETGSPGPMRGRLPKVLTCSRLLLAALLQLPAC